MSKKTKCKGEKLSGAEGFDAYYSRLFGARWAILKAALSAPPVYAELRCGGEPYFLDPASVLAASRLPLAGAKRVLDLCAAPGGKTLTLAALMDADATLYSNERSAARKNRLSAVCSSCLSSELRQRVRIMCSDGALWCRTQRECYDCILLDAPCSSERHVLADSAYLCKWSPARIKTLALEQWALLSSAYRLLSPGGFLLYSTCALTPAENDDIIARLLKKFPDAVKVSVLPPLPAALAAICRAPFFPNAAQTEQGFHILPDVQNGAGPIWFSLIQKPVAG